MESVILCVCNILHQRAYLRLVSFIVKVQFLKAIRLLYIGTSLLYRLHLDLFD